MPATTASRPASPRQISYLRSLVTERNLLATSTPLAHEVSAVLNGGPIARDLIDRVMAVPRATTRTESSGELLTTPTDVTRAGRMLLAGGIEATVTLPDERHVTINIRTRARSGRGWRNASPTEDGARTNISVLGSKVGWINVVDGRWNVTLRTRNEGIRNAVFALFNYAGSGLSDLRVQEASRCGRCMRTLTDPVSIDRGIGPECYGRETGSRHAALDAALAQAGTTRSELATEARRQATVTGQPGAPTEQEANDFAVAALDSYEAARRDRAHDAEFARREREQEAAAYRLEAEDEAARGISAAATETLTALADRAAATHITPAAMTRARDLIAEALDANCSDTDMAFAMRIFDTLAAR
jgi:hypothetical protein